MKILFIGTFNPDNESCIKQNNALWFYGRDKSKFWRYMPVSLNGVSLHPLDTVQNGLQVWRQYCLDNDLVIIDLVKRIQSNEPLTDFGDRMVNSRITNALDNVECFDIGAAFSGVKFERVVYSLRWTDQTINRLIVLRDLVNKALLDAGCIENVNQIKYCLTPSRNDQNTIDSWRQSMND